MAQVTGKNIIASRKAMGPGKPSPSSLHIPDTTSVVEAAKKEAEMAVQLGEQVTRYRAEAVEKQFEIEEDLTREIREHMDEVHGELEELAGKLKATMKSL